MSTLIKADDAKRLECSQLVAALFLPTSRVGLTNLLFDPDKAYEFLISPANVRSRYENVSQSTTIV